MRSAWPVLLFLSTVPLAGQPVPGAPAQAIHLTSSRAQDGGMTVWEIPFEKASRLPRWSPEAGPPVLADAEVVSAARAWLTRRLPTAQRFELQNISLSRVRRGADVDLWYYQVDFFAYGPTGLPGGPLVKAVILPDGSVVEPVQSDSLPNGVYRPGPGITMPRALRQVSAEYTADALKQKITGSVRVQGVVGIDGSFHDLHVVQSLDALYGLDEAALKAAAQWQFAPGTKDGEPVPVLVTVELTFNTK